MNAVEALRELRQDVAKQRAFYEGQREAYDELLRNGIVVDSIAEDRINELASSAGREFETRSVILDTIDSHINQHEVAEEHAAQASLADPYQRCVQPRSYGAL